jgi:hypothetical protein
VAIISAISICLDRKIERHSMEESNRVDCFYEDDEIVSLPFLKEEYDQTALWESMRYREEKPSFFSRVKKIHKIEEEECGC